MTQKHERRPHEATREHHDPACGSAEPGCEFSPADRPDDTVSPEKRQAPRPAPAPGVPVPARKYERLKDEARRRRREQDAPAQEDRPRKPDK